MSLRLSQEILFWRTLGHLTHANISLFEALSIVKTTIVSFPLQTLINRLQDGVLSGNSLSDMCARESQLSSFQTKMISLAEKTGDYGTIFGLIADQLVWRQTWRTLVIQAIRYPMILLGLMGILFSVLILLVLPGVQTQLDLLGIRDIPIATRVLIFVGRYPDFLIGVVIALGIVCYGFRAWRRHRVLRPWRYDVPLIGDILYQLQITQFLHALGVMLSAKQDVLTSLYQAAQTPTCEWVRHQLSKREHRLVEGQNLSTALFGLLPPSSPAAALIPIGEATGDLGKLLTITCESDLDTLRLRLKMILDLIQPGLVLVMGAVMVWVILAILLPLYEAVGQWHG